MSHNRPPMRGFRKRPVATRAPSFSSWLIMISVQTQREEGDDERRVAVLLDDLALLGSHDDLELFLVVVVHVFAGQRDFRLGAGNGLLAQGAPVAFFQGGAGAGQPLLHGRYSLGLDGRQYRAAGMERKLANFTKYWLNCRGDRSLVACAIAQLFEIKEQCELARVSL